MEQESAVSLTDKKIAIVAPHMDDEFIGCHRIFELFGSNIDQVVYFTDNSLQANYRDQSTVAYIQQRISESEKYLDTFSPDCVLNMVEMPDGLDDVEYNKKCFPNDSVQQVNKSLVEYFKMWLSSCDIIFMPIIEDDHASHRWCNQICTRYVKETQSDYVLYYSHAPLFAKTQQGEPNTCITKKTSVGYIKVFNHRKGEKNQLFKSYFPSQYKRFESQNIIISDREMYASPINIDLEPANNVVDLIKT